MERFMDDDMLVEHGKDTTQMWVKYEDCVQEIALTNADAQATIAALQARVQELESNRVPNSMQHVIELQAMNNRLGVRVETLESQLTQRTVERDTARRRVDELETREVDVVLLRDDLEQRTAELEALKIHCAIVEEHKVIAYKDAANLQAELERVRGLVRALPAYKDISVSHRIDENDYESWHVWVDHNPLAECDTEEEANAIKALYEHRQGMEG